MISLGLARSRVNADLLPRRRRLEAQDDARPPRPPRSLRKLLWGALAAAVGALATIGAPKAVEAVYGAARAQVALPGRVDKVEGRLVPLEEDLAERKKEQAVRKEADERVARLIELLERAERARAGKARR